MIVKTLVVARIIAWGVAAGVLAAVMLRIDSLPETLPVSRWTSAPKSLLVALRVPLINLLSVGIIEILSRSFRRLSEFHRADSVVSVLFLTAAAKAGIEGAGILLLPVSLSWSMLPLITLLCAGLGSTLYFSRDFLHSRQWQYLAATRIETIGMVVLVIGIVILNLPLLIQ